MIRDLNRCPRRAGAERWRAPAALLAALVGIALPVTPASAEATNDALFERATAALEKKKLAQAIQDFESLADQAPPHPDMAFNRGMAYAERARSPSAVQGDLGRAAAAFEEASRLDPRDREAERALELVRAEVTRRRSRLDKEDVVVRPALDRVILRALPSAVWGWIAIAFSILFAVGLFLRQRWTGNARVAGAVMAPLSFLGCLVVAPIALLSKDLEETVRPAVVVVGETQLADADGNPVEGPPIPEASLLEIEARQGDRFPARWGSYSGFVPAEHVRPLLVR